MTFMPNLADRNKVAFSERRIMKGTDKVERPEMHGVLCAK